MIDRHKIAAKVFGPVAANRNLADEPLSVDDWRKVWEALQGFRAAVRQIVLEARIRNAELRTKQQEQSNGEEA